MPEPSDYLRITVRLRQLVESELIEDLSAVAPYYRSKRLVSLARQGLAIERGAKLVHMAASFSPSRLQPMEASPHTTIAQPLSTGTSKSKGDAGTKAYEPDLDALWNSGIMG